MFQESTWGMTVRPTVMPAIMSETNHSKLYLGSQVTIGIRLFTFFTKNKDSLSPCQTNLLEKRLDSPVFLFDQQPSLEGLGLWIKRLLKRFFGGHHPFWKCLISSPSIITAFPSPGPPLSVFPLPPCCSPAFSHLDQKQKYHIAFSQITFTPQIPLSPSQVPSSVFREPFFGFSCIFPKVDPEMKSRRWLMPVLLPLTWHWLPKHSSHVCELGQSKINSGRPPCSCNSRVRTIDNWSCRGRVY